MDDINRIFHTRLKELFGEEKQEDIARRYNTTQANISKWETGKALPKAEDLQMIARDYGVSLDWLLGISNQKEADALDESKLTYEHAIRILDMFLSRGLFDIPDLNDYTEKPHEDEKEANEDVEEKDSHPDHVPRINSDILHITDRALSYLLRRRMKLKEVGEDAYEYWKEHWDVFSGIRLLDYSGSMKEAIDTRPLAEYTKDGDWATVLTEMGRKTEAELREMIEKSREKGGKENGTEQHR